MSGIGLRGLGFAAWASGFGACAESLLLRIQGCCSGFSGLAALVSRYCKAY